MRFQKLFDFGSRRCGWRTAREPTALDRRDRACEDTAAVEEFDKTLYLLMNYYNTKPNFTKSGIPIDNVMNEDQKIIVDNINKYFESDEILNIIVVQNEAYNSQTITKKNIVLSGYIKRKEKIENIKTFVKIMGFIVGFIFILYLMVHFFGNKENSSMNQNNKN